MRVPIGLRFRGLRNFNEAPPHPLTYPIIDGAQFGVADCRRREGRKGENPADPKVSPRSNNFPEHFDFSSEHDRSR